MLADYIAVLARMQGDCARGRAVTPPAVLVQRHGRAYTEFSPQSVRLGPIKLCFMNTLHLCLQQPELTYVEGWALNMIPAPHAWAVDPGGRIIETTWREPGHEYFGIPFATSYARRAALESGFYGLLDNWNWPNVLTDDPATFVRGMESTA